MKLHVTLYVTLHALHAHAQFPAMPYSQMMPMGMPSMPSMPSMPMQMPIIGPPQMPSVVMPYHSRTADRFRKKPRQARKRRRRHRHHKESDSSSGSGSDSSSSSDETVYRAARDGRKRRRQVLTPVVSYVTKDGYVVYQKKIKKDRAQDWLELGQNSGLEDAPDKEHDFEDKMEEKMGRMKQRLSKSKRKRYDD